MDLKSILESVLFAAQKPLSPQELRALLSNAAEESSDATAQSLKKTKLEDVEAAIEQLSREHAEAQRTYRLVCVAGAWQFVSQPEYAPWLKALLGKKNRPPRLSQPALETLAIIAYRQPLTRAEIEQIRGVSVDGVMQTLIERGLVEHVGRADIVGRPMTYATTALFLDYFGLRSLEDLPAADELRRLEVKKPEGLLTADSGLATAPPTQLASTGSETGNQSVRASERPSVGASEPESVEPSSAPHAPDAPRSDASHALRKAEPEPPAPDAPGASLLRNPRTPRQPPES